MKSTIRRSLLLCLFFSSTLFAQPEPNIILIIADDMGWNQVSSNITTNVDANDYGSDFYETPRIDQLASEGIAFPYGYVNGGNCAPTRAALLSGQFAARPHNNVFTVYDLNRGNTSENSNLIGPAMGLASNAEDQIPSSAITIAETLKTAGYITGHWGKYHSGEDEATNFSNNAATDQGFDYNYGGGQAGGPGDYFASSSAPYTFGSNIGPELDVYATPYTAAESLMLAGNNSLDGTPKHISDAMADAAIDFMSANSASPFFMHFSNFAIHGPFGESHARPDLRAKYNAKAISNPGSMDHASDPGQAAIAEGMDQTIGRLVDYLKITDDPRNPDLDNPGLFHPLSKNTLVYFISDNGDAIKRTPQAPLRGMKGEYYEGGIRSVTFAWSEAPWLANKGTVNTTPIVAFDLYPTFVEAAGGTLPSNYDIDGESQWQMLTNGSSMTRESMFWHHPGYLIDSKRDSRPVTVVRKGNYKLMHFYEDAKYELYDVVTDISETNNLLPSSDPVIIVVANDMIDDMNNHLTETNAPMPTFRTGGATVPDPVSVSISTVNSTDGCQPENTYDAFWDFDFVSDTNDVSGNGNNANSINGTLTYDGSDFIEGDRSVVFDGSVDITYSSATFLSQVTTARTISAWIKPDGIIATQNIFEEGGSDDGIALRLKNSNIEAIAKSTSGGTNTILAAYPNDGNWHHVALVFDGGNSTLTMYIDGVYVASGSAPTEIPSHNVTGGGIGGVIGSWDSFGESANNYFIGKMDAFAVYDSVLLEEQIENSACYTPENSTAGIQPELGYQAFYDFDTANDEITDDVNDIYNAITVTGNVIRDASDTKEGDQSAYFDGATKVQYNDGGFLNTKATNRTVAVWLKPDALNGGIQNIYDEGSDWKGITLRLNENKIQGQVNNREPETSASVEAILVDTNWHHIVLVFKGGVSLTLYIDGVEQDAETTGVPPSKNSASNDGGIGGVFGSDAFGGNSNDNHYYFKGKMDAFAIYNSTLSAEQISNMNPTVVESGDTLLVDEDLTLNALMVNPGGNVIISAGNSLTVTSILTNNGTVTLKSNSTSYSSLIPTAISGSGTVNYERYTNIMGSDGTGGNDLVSPPLSSQPFNEFVTANTGVLAVNGGATIAAYAPFNNNANAYQNFGTGVITPLVAAKGYRAATIAGGALIYEGTVSTGPIDVDITDDTSNWNLMGNPYPSYLKVLDFLNETIDTGVTNIDLLDDETKAIYGYDGDASDGWVIYNLNTTAGTLIAPGQGFFVNADPAQVAAYDIKFSTSQRSIGASDDFITGKSTNAKASANYNLKLQLVSGSKLYKTDFYFNDNSSLGLDPGYDAALYGSTAPSFALYSHLVEGNVGKDMGIQSLSLQALESVTIPLGINAASGEAFTLSIASSTLDAGTYVYLKDHVANELTLLNDADFNYTPSEDLTTTGQFSIIFSASEVLAIDNIKAQNGLEIYTNHSEKTLYINGVLNDSTSVTLFDIQGREILRRRLNVHNRSNRLELSHLNTGIYIVQVNSNRIKQTKKVVVN